MPDPSALIWAIVVAIVGSVVAALVVPAVRHWARAVVRLCAKHSRSLLTRVRSRRAAPTAMAGSEEDTPTTHPNQNDREAIFVRESGKTHPAEPEDIENLEQRVQGAHLDLDLAFVGDLPISWFDKPALIAAITQVADSEKEAQLRRARQTQEPDARADAYRISRTMARVLAGPDDRTIEQHADEVAQWHSQWTERAPEHWMSAYAAAGHGMCSLSLTNLTDHNFASVEVCLEIPGARVITDLDEVETDLPKMPRPFGQGRSPFGIAGLDRLSVSTLRVAGLDYAPTVWVDNDDDGAFVTWEVGDVRPEQTLDTDPLYVLVGEAPSTRQLSIGWSATSTSVSGVARGAIHLPLSDRPVPLDSIEPDLGLS